MDAALEIWLLGDVNLKLEGEPITELTSQKATALLIYLVCHPNPISREVLADLFYGHLPQERAKANLSVLLNRLNTLSTYLTVTRQAVAFNHDSAYWLDAQAFETKVIGVLKQNTNDNPLIPDGVTQLEIALALYKGDFLAGFHLPEALGFEEWMVIERERLHYLAIEGLERLVEYHMALSHNHEALAAVNRLLRLDPLHEVAHRHKMALLARTGHRPEALAHYQVCRQILAEELGVEPSLRTTALYQRIQTMRDEVPHNLPSPTTLFLGRAEELAWLNRHLQQPNSRLLTVVGLGGIGKTRLALQAATQFAFEPDQAEYFPDGVFFVSLQGLDPKPERLVCVIADVLHIQIIGPECPVEQLVMLLRDKQMLLILDNFEPFLPPTDNAAETLNLLAQIVQRASQVKLLVTSREPLKLYGERLLRLEGLNFPQQEAFTLGHQVMQLSLQPVSIKAQSLAPSLNGIPKKSLSTAMISQYSAINLFVQRARHMLADFTLSEADIPAVIRLCHVVEGLPLGLELAAAWVDTLSCREIADELEQGIDLLTTPQPDMLARHQSLPLVLDQIWNRLTATEQRVLRQLTIFQGCFSRDAAEQVAQVSLPILSALVNKSLLRHPESGCYQFHELLRQMALQKLQVRPEEEVEVRRRHGIYYVNELIRQLPRLQGSDNQLEALQTLSQSFEDVRLAWEWGTKYGSFERMTEAATPLLLFFIGRNWPIEGEETFQRATLTIAAREETGPLKTKLMGTLNVYRARFLVQLGLVDLGLTITQAGRRQLQESGLDIQFELGSVSLVLGMLTFAKGDIDQAEQHFQNSYEYYHTALAEWWLPGALYYRTSIIELRGDYVLAKQIYEKVLTATRQNKDQKGMALALISLGRVSNILGEYQQAEIYSQESLAISEILADLDGLAQSLENLGRTAHARGEYSQARLYFNNALNAAIRTRALTTGLGILVSLARLRRDQGEILEAVTLLMIVAEHPYTEIQVRLQAKQLLADWKTQLSPDILAAAQAQSKATTLETIIKMILDRGNKKKQ